MRKHRQGRRPWKLTSKKVSEIRKLLELGVKQRDIAKSFGIGESHLSAIKHGDVWRE